MKSPTTHTEFEDPAAFAMSLQTVAGVRALVATAATRGLYVLESWGWKTGSRNAVGRVRVEDRRGNVLYSVEWDVGACRPPANNFRLTSRHGKVLISALTFVRDRITSSIA